jgi:hypothetical protein
MSGFGLLFDKQDPVSFHDQDFVNFQSCIASYKCLDSAHSCEISGLQCAAVKFDTRSTLHRGITVDEQTGSWLLVVGTVLRDENNPKDGSLQDLLTDYIERGSVVFKDLDGHFVLVVYDKVSDRLLVVSDPLGMMPVYYAWRGRRLYVSTSALAIAKAVQATPSEYGIYCFLKVGEMRGTYTLWQGVERLSAGTILEITHAGNTKSIYWSLTVNDEVARLSLDDTVDYSLALLSKAVKRGIEREGKVWVDLTGGFDSRLVAMLMDHVGLPFEVCCAGPQRYIDVIISSRIAQGLGWDYQHNILPEDWGKARCKWLSRAIGKTDGHLDVLKSSSVLWDQEQRALERDVSVWGLGGELWRSKLFSLQNVKKGSRVDYDRLIDHRVSVERAVLADDEKFTWICEELKTLLKSVGERYANFPNTVKLDSVLLFYERGHTGLQIATVMGQQRAIAPLDFKESVAGAFSIHYKWRIYNRLVKLLLEKVNPVLAGFETDIGSPALPLRATNFYKFIPFLPRMAKKLARKAAKDYLGWNLWPESSESLASYPLDYPTFQWRCQTLDYLEQEDLLNHKHMHSAALYDAEGLADFLAGARTAGFRHEKFLSYILTVEMALRAVGASL